MSKQVDLLSRPVNFAVVQLPERNFPGVVVQGDTLDMLLRQLARMAELLATNEIDELAAEIEDMREQLADAAKHYESVCELRGIELPYSKSEQSKEPGAN